MPIHRKDLPVLDSRVDHRSVNERDLAAAMRTGVRRCFGPRCGCPRQSNARRNVAPAGDRNERSYESESMVMTKHA